MAEVEDFIYQKEGQQREILLHLHHIFAEELMLESKLRYSIPFYYQNSWICYLNPIKNDGIELVFLRGNELSNSTGLLQSKGRKQVSGIEFYRPDQVTKEQLYEIIQEALILDETVPYASKRQKNQNK